MLGTLPLPWKNSNQYEILKRVVEVLADSDKPWRLESVLGGVPDGAGVSAWEKRKLARFIMKKVKQKKEEIYNYELSKFALGEANDLRAAKRNAESLGYYAYEMAEEEKLKAQQAKMQAQMGNKTINPFANQSILQQYNNRLQKDQIEKMYGAQNSALGCDRYGAGLTPEQWPYIKEGKMSP